MANSLSAKKRIRQGEKRNIRNRLRKSQLKTQTRKFTDALTAANPEQAEAELKQTIKKLDQIAAKGTIHKNAAARRKSRLQKRLIALKTKR